MGSLCSKGVNEAAAATSHDVYLAHPNEQLQAPGSPVQDRPTHPHLAALSQAPKSGSASTPRAEASSQPARRLQDLPFDVLKDIGQNVAPREAFALSRAGRTLREAVGERPQVHLAETLGNIQPHRRQEVCDHLLDTLPTVPVSRQHTLLGPLAREFDRIPESPARTASAKRLWEASINLPEPHRGNVISHLNVGWFPAVERTGRLGGLIESAAALYQTNQVPAYDQLYRRHGAYDEDYEHSNEVSSLRTPLWSAKAQTYMLPIDQRDRVRARIRQLEGEVTNTVERLFPRPADQSSNSNHDSISYAIGLMDRGFTDHEAGYLAGVRDLAPLRSLTLSRRPGMWRYLNNVPALSDFVRAHEDGRVPQ